MAIYLIGIIVILAMACAYLVLTAIGANKTRPAENQKPTAAAPTKQTPQAQVANGALLEKKIMLEETISVIKELNEALSLSLKINEAAEKIVKTASGVLNAEICALLLLDESTNTLSVAASVGIDEKTAKAIRIKKGEEISGLTAKFNDIKILNDFNNEREVYNLKQDACYKNNLASFPLSFKNKALGVLNVSNKKSGKPFSETDIETIKIIALGSAAAIQNAKLFQEQQKTYLDTIIALANAIDARDSYTYHHSNNVARYSVRIAEEMQLAKERIEKIKHAALLHDIGKIGVKDNILLKDSKLSEEEYAKILMHPVKGEEIIESLPFLQERAKIIRHHHERFDGKGYPDGIKGEDIELEARILALADSFDAMTTQRPYRAPLSIEETKKELLKNKGIQFDPSIVDIFIKILDKDPAIVNRKDS